MNNLWRFCSTNGKSVSASKGGQTTDRHHWIADHAPVFRVAGSQVDVIRKPSDFFQTIQSEAAKASKRIVISSLYLGTGKLETELVNVIHSNLKSRAAADDVRVRFLLDYTRGFRGQHNSVTMLLPVLQQFQKNVQISLYHTPDLRGCRKQLMPERWNEIVGVQHMKVYMFDDNLLMSGANLSNDYFTNRQDRYIIFRNCPALCDFFENLVEAVSSVSFTVKPNGSVQLPRGLDTHPFKAKDNGLLYKKVARERIMPVISSRTGDSSAYDSTASPELDTWIYPIIEMGPFNISVDNQVTQQFLRIASKESKVYLASGYFNLTEDYKHLIVNNARAKFEVLMASPKVNGFFGARGMAGGIPHAYTNIAKQFYQSVCSKCYQDRIRMYEYYRDGWTFHAKGLWYYPPGASLPSTTFIGSPNFGYRSAVRDLEAQLVVVTENPQLQEKLHQEQTRLYSRSEQVTAETFKRPERRVPLWVRTVTTFFKNFF